MWKVTWKGLVAHKLRFALTALAVFLGVAFMSGTMVLGATIQTTFDNLFTDIYRNTDAVVRAKQVLSSDFGSGMRPAVPESLVNDVRTVPGVADAQPNVAIDYAQIVDLQGKAVGKHAQGPPALGFNWNPNPTLNPFHLLRGSRPPASDGEVVIDKRSADDGKLTVGDRVEILTAQAPKQYTIVGVAKFGTANSLAGASAVLFTLPEAQRLANSVGKVDSIAVEAQKGVSQSQIKSNLQERFAGTGSIEVLTGKEIIKENQSAIRKNLKFINISLLVFALVALVVGAFIIYNTFSIVVAQRSREMALLRAIGASSSQVLDSVVLESVVVGLLASAIGVIGGIGLSLGLKTLMSAFGFDIPGSGVTVPPYAVIIGLSVGTVVTVLSALLPAFQASRVPPVAAMRDVAIERPVNRRTRLAVGGTLFVAGVAGVILGLVAGFGGPLMIAFGAVGLVIGIIVLMPLFARRVSLSLGAPAARLRGITGQLGRENAARNPRRTTLTASALLICVAIVAFIMVFAQSTKASFLKAVDSQIKSDYIVSGPGFQPVLPTSLAPQIAALPEIQSATPVRGNVAGIAGNRVPIVATDPSASQLFDFGDVAGSLSALTPDGIGVSQQEADTQHWKYGDTIPATFVDTGPTDLKIEFIYKQRLIVGNYLMSIAGFDKHYRQQTDFQIFAKLKPGVSAEQGRAAIEPLLKNIPVAQLKDNAQYKADQVARFNQLLGLVYGMLVLAVIIALIGIANTLALSIYERTHEIGLLRAVGTARRQVRSTVRWEAVIVAVFGTLVGIAIGLFFGWALIHSLSDQGITTFDPAIGQLVVVVIVAAIAGVIAAIFPARRAAKLDVLRAVSSE